MRGIGEQGMAVQVVLKNVSAGFRALLMRHRFESQRVVDLRGCLNDEGRGVLVKLVSVGPYPAMIRAFENEGEGITERLVRAKPYELVWARFDRAAKLVKKSISDSRVKTVTCNDYVCISEASIDVIHLNFLLEMQVNAQFARPFVQKLQEAFAA